VWTSPDGSTRVETKGGALDGPLPDVMDGLARLGNRLVAVGWSGSGSGTDAAVWMA
jgi:hypothetical protein